MRSRNIKPGFFKNDRLAELDPLCRILFAGLWCLADREGRLKDRPARIKAEILPYDHEADCNGMLERLVKAQFIVRYQVGEGCYIQVRKFEKHQSPHKTERASEIPAPDDNDAITVQTPNPNDTNRPDSLIPDSLIPDSPSEAPSGASCPESSPKDSGPPPVITIPTNKNGQEYPVTKNQVEEWVKAYPAVDVEQELGEMRAWSLSNPTRRKTMRGMTRFVNSWLSREQDRGDNGQPRASPGKPTPAEAQERRLSGLKEFAEEMAQKERT